MSIEFPFVSLTEMMDFLKLKNLSFYPENPFKAISFDKDKAKLQLHCGPNKTGENIYSIYGKFCKGVSGVTDRRSLALTDENVVSRPYTLGGVNQLDFRSDIKIGKAKTNILLNSEFKENGVNDVLIEKEYYLTISIKVYDSEMIASIFDPEQNFLKKEIDKGNYSSLNSVLFLHRGDIFKTVENDFALLVGRFAYKGKDYIVIPSIKHSYRIVRVPAKRPDDLNYRSGSTYALTVTGFRSTGGGISW